MKGLIAKRFAEVERLEILSTRLSAKADDMMMRNTMAGVRLFPHEKIMTARRESEELWSRAKRLRNI